VKNIEKQAKRDAMQKQTKETTPKTSEPQKTQEKNKKNKEHLYLCEDKEKEMK